MFVKHCNKLRTICSNQSTPWYAMPRLLGTCFSWNCAQTGPRIGKIGCYHDCKWRSRHLKTKCIRHRAWVRTQTLPLWPCWFPLETTKGSGRLDSTRSLYRRHFVVFAVWVPLQINATRKKSFPNLFLGMDLLLSLIHVQWNINEQHTCSVLITGSAITFYFLWGGGGLAHGAGRERVVVSPDEKLVVRCATFCVNCWHLCDFGPCVAVKTSLPSSLIKRLHLRLRSRFLTIGVWSLKLLPRTYSRMGQNNSTPCGCLSALCQCLATWPLGLWKESQPGSTG